MSFDLVSIVVLCLLLEAFFAGAEIAIVSMSRAQLKYLVQKGSRRATALMKILDKPEWFLGTTLLGANLAVIALNSYATIYFIERFGEKWGFLAAFFTAPLVLFIGEALPKTLFQRFSDFFAIHLVYPLRAISIVLSPVVGIFALISRLAIRSTGISVQKKTPFLTREELELIYHASEKESGFKEMERRMIDRVFSFSKKPAREIMIPLVDVVSIREDAKMDEATRQMKQSGFSRYPVYAYRIDHIVGWLNHFDLLRVQDPRASVRPFIREIHFFPQTIYLGRLLLEMQRRKDRIVMLVDEYGGIVGMVTLEDVIEEVVGDIEDEYDYRTSFVRKIDPKSLVVHARIPIKTINEILPVKIPEGDYDTLAGFLLSQTHRIPKVGESYQIAKNHFRILKANVRAVEEVEIVL